MKVDHIGIAVSSIERALPFYKKALGLEPSHREDVPDQKVKVCFLQAGETALELIEPTGESGVSKFLQSRGPGIHHVAFSVSGIDGEMKRLRDCGIPPLESAARPGARGHKVCFLHPKLADGVLIELVEAAH